MRNFIRGSLLLALLLVLLPGCSGKVGPAGPSIPDGFKEFKTMDLSSDEDGAEPWVFKFYSQKDGIEPGAPFNKWFGNGDFLSWLTQTVPYNDDSEAGKNGKDGSAEVIKKHFGTWDAKAQAESLGGGVWYQPFQAPDGKMWIVVFESRGDKLYGVLVP